MYPDNIRYVYARIRRRSDVKDRTRRSSRERRDGDSDRKSRKDERSGDKKRERGRDGEKEKGKESDRNKGRSEKEEKEKESDRNKSKGEKEEKEKTTAPSYVLRAATSTIESVLILVTLQVEPGRWSGKPTSGHDSQDPCCRVSK